MLRWMLAGAAMLAAASVAGVGGAGPPEPSGSIIGHVAFRPMAAQRVVNRYPGAGPAIHLVESVPAIAYIDGPVPDHPPTLGERPRMAQHDTTFNPEILFVPIGTTVEFPNQDGFFHNVFSYSKAKRFDLGRFPRGESKTVKFDNPGLVNVYCEIHKWMRGVVVVVENPYYE